MRLFRELSLFSAEPNPECAPTGNDWHGDVTNRAQTKAEMLHAAIRPRAELIAAAITESINETFRLVFVLAPQNGEQYLTRRPHEREGARPPHNLESCEHEENRCEAHCRKTKKTEHRHEKKRHRHAKEFHQPTGEKNLKKKRKGVHRKIELREERRARGFIGESRLGQLGLLKISPGRSERVEKDKQEKSEQVRRFANVRQAVPKFAADRFLGGGDFARF